jgi:hypothetical protein
MLHCRFDEFRAHPFVLVLGCFGSNDLHRGRIPTERVKRRSESGHAFQFEREDEGGNKKPSNL